MDAVKIINNANLRMDVGDLTRKQYENLIAPLRDVEVVRHGWWETVEDWDGDEHYKCSVCGAEFVLIDGSPEDNDYLFCPHCGAKNDREEGGNNAVS